MRDGAVGGGKMVVKGGFFGEGVLEDLGSMGRLVRGWEEKTVEEEKEDT